MREVKNIQNTYKHRTLSQIAHEIGITKFDDSAEEQENIEKGYEANQISFQKQSERPRQIFSRSRSHRTINTTQKASDKEPSKAQTSNKTFQNDIDTVQEEPTVVSKSSSKPNEKADTDTINSSEAFKKSESNNVSNELDEIESCTTTSKTNDFDKRKRVRKSRRVTSETLLAIDDGARKARVSKTASNASGSQKDNEEEIVPPDTTNPTSNSCKFISFLRNIVLFLNYSLL